jgi:hypothetical protein
MNAELADRMKCFKRRWGMKNLITIKGRIDQQKTSTILLLLRPSVWKANGAKSDYVKTYQVLDLQDQLF